mmetsp:Transcript_26338/g.85056  ORF Transcript_26338/g.85056 Transcript_26338/m.85056 type:complete len:205 (+) Transcript_26338:761-1375(+)
MCGRPHSFIWTASSFSPTAPRSACTPTRSNTAHPRTTLAARLSCATVTPCVTLGRSPAPNTSRASRAPPRTCRQSPSPPAQTGRSLFSTGARASSCSASTMPTTPRWSRCPYSRGQLTPMPLPPRATSSCPRHSTESSSCGTCATPPPAPSAPSPPTPTASTRCSPLSPRASGTPPAGPRTGRHTCTMSAPPSWSRSSAGTRML